MDGNSPVRTNPDNKKNSYGNSFIKFLKDNRSIILNGRVTPHLNNFTFVSTRRSSVPEYFYCPTEQLDFCTEMRVSLMSDIVNLTGFTPTQILPDHSILTGRFKCSFSEVTRNNVPSDEYNFGQKSQNEKKAPRKNLRKIKEPFFLCPDVHIQVLETIN